MLLLARSKFERTCAWTPHFARWKKMTTRTRTHTRARTTKITAYFHWEAADNCTPLPHVTRNTRCLAISLSSLLLSSLRESPCFKIPLYTL